MKMLDPSSVVRESEQAQVINASGLPGRLQNYVTSLQGGHSLNETQVSEIRAAAESLAGAYRSVYDKVAEPYRKMAADYGLDPDQVVMNRWSSPKQAQSPSATGLPDGYTVVP